MKTNTKNQSATNQLTKFQKKKQINLKWNATLSFQVGLILSLLLVGLIVESVWVELPESSPYTVGDPPDEEFNITGFVVEPDFAKVAEVLPKPKPQQRVATVLKVVSNTTSTVNQPTLVTDPPTITVDTGTTTLTTETTPKEPLGPVPVDLVCLLYTSDAADE